MRVPLFGAAPLSGDWGLKRDCRLRSNAEEDRHKQAMLVRYLPPNIRLQSALT